MRMATAHGAWFRIMRMVPPLSQFSACSILTKFIHTTSSYVRMKVAKSRTQRNVGYAKMLLRFQLLATLSYHT